MVKTMKKKDERMNSSRRAERSRTRGMSAKIVQDRRRVIAGDALPCEYGDEGLVTV